MQIVFRPKRWSWDVCRRDDRVAVRFLAPGLQGFAGFAKLPAWGIQIRRRPLRIIVAVWRLGFGLGRRAW